MKMKKRVAACLFLVLPW